MFAWLLVAGVLSGSLSATAHNSIPAQHVESKLKGLTPAEANLLVAKLQHAQTELRAGRNETFELIAGAPASNPAAQMSPRRTFIEMSFEHPWSIERKATTGLWQPYELVYFPPGPHSLMWKVKVVVGQMGQLVRVELLYTAPPPF